MAHRRGFLVFRAESLVFIPRRLRLAGYLREDYVGTPNGRKVSGQSAEVGSEQPSIVEPRTTGDSDETGKVFVYQGLRRAIRGYSVF
jgi:hypothetical protein